MDETEILIGALKIDSLPEREAFLLRQCSGDPKKLSAIRQALALHSRLREKPFDQDDFELRQHVEDLLTANGVTRDIDLAVATQAGQQDKVEAVSVFPATEDFQSAAGQGTIIADRYVLQKPIGEGGMGEVWSAKQIAPVKRRVALKLIKKGMDSRAVLQRFEQERQALAMMDHPNIARVFDAGMTQSGQPYFVMELVNGLPLTQFADEVKLTTVQRLELFVPVCNAIQHAHQKGIVHRDLKPANILVTMIDGKAIPKVIDFGVAKATGGSLTEHSLETQFGAIVGTLEYMAPEQAGYSGVDIDTRADIYSLGVVLYELLTGLRPIDRARLKEAGLAEMIRVIKEEEPSKPSTRLSTNESLPSLAAVRQIDPRKLTALMKGELDWVVMKCLEKSRERRYETANGLGRDIQRFLNGEMVDARPASTSYRFTKFLRRNRGPVIAGGLLLAAMLTGIIGTTWGFFEATKQAKKANREAVEKELARQDATNRAESERKAKLEAETERSIAEMNRDEALKQTAIAKANELEAETRLKQLEQATAALVGVFENLDPFSEEKEGLPLRQILARNLKDTAVSLSSLSGTDSISIARMQTLLGQAMADLGDFEGGTTVLERALATFRQISGPDDPETLNTANSVALAYRMADRLDDALALLTDTLQRSKATRGIDNIETLGCMNSLAITYRTAGQMDKALPLYLETEKRTRALMGDDSQPTLAATNDLAMAYKEMGDLEKALPLFLDTLAKARVTSGDSHPFTLNTMNNLANLYGQSKQHDLSIPLYVEALAGRRFHFGPSHPYTLQSMNSLGMAYVENRQVDKALPLLAEAFAGREARLGPNHRDTMRSMQTLAEAYVADGETDRGLQTMSELLLRMEKHLGPDHPDTMYLMNNLAASYWQVKQFDQSLPLFEKLWPLHKEKMGPDHPLTINVQGNLGVNLRDAGRLTEAVAMLEDAVKRMQKHPPRNVARLSWIPIVMNSTYELAGQFDKAEDYYRQSWRDVVEILGEDHPKSAEASVQLAINLLKQSKYQEASELLKSALSVRRENSPEDWTTFHTQSLLGEALMGLEQFEEAETQLTAGYAKMKSREASIPPDSIVRLSEAADRLVRFYQQQNMPDEAKKWQVNRL